MCSSRTACSTPPPGPQYHSYIYILLYHKYTRTKPYKQTPTRGSFPCLPSVLLSKAFHILGVLSVYTVEFLSAYNVEFLSVYTVELFPHYFMCRSSQMVYLILYQFTSDTVLIIFCHSFLLTLFVNVSVTLTKRHISLVLLTLYALSIVPVSTEGSTLPSMLARNSLCAGSAAVHLYCHSFVISVAVQLFFGRYLGPSTFRHRASCI